MSDEQNTPDESSCLKIANWLTENALAGFGPMSSAHDLALEYIMNTEYADNDDCVDSLINRETTKNFSAGFLTGLGGFITFPIAIPASLGASWLIQARMVAAIAEIYGHDTSSDKIKTAILLTLIGQDITAVLKGVGIKVGTKFAYKAIEKIPTAVLTKINQQVGFRLLTKVGKKGVSKFPIVVAGFFPFGLNDTLTCRVTAKLAKEVFCKSTIDFTPRCAKCGAMIPADVKFCPECGAKQGISE